jgi:hypothetical protein
MGLYPGSKKVFCRLAFVEEKELKKFIFEHYFDCVRINDGKGVKRIVSKWRMTKVLNAKEKELKKKKTPASENLMN